MQYDTIVTAPGSLGDVNPLLGLARSLQARGRRVLFLAAEPYLHLAGRAGLQTRILTTREDFNDLVKNPNIWHPRRGPKLLLDNMLGASINPHYEWLLENCVPGETLLVSHFLDFGGRVFRDRFPKTKLVTVILAPALLRSLTAPPRVTRFGIECQLPRSLLRVAYWCADRFIDSLALKHINPLRRRIGLQPVRRMMKDWWLSPDVTIAMFPDWFSIPPNDVPKQVKTVGFPLTDSAALVAPEVDQQLQRILAGFGGARPVVFAPGSAHFQARSFLAKAADACRRLNLPAILLSANPDEVPRDLPSNIVTAEYLPFSKLFPLARAVVHHGGIGTTSQCFAAGIPQLVLPMAFDQFDNAARVEKLGCGSWMPMTRVSVSALTQRLDGLILTAASAELVAENFKAESMPCEKAAQACLAIV
jgi:UDP:flavonoid glycosyltransferase YjiC (YdhE family)